jgi:hypothetical protein
MRGAWLSIACAVVLVATLSSATHAQEAATPAPAAEEEKPSGFSIALHNVASFGTHEDSFLNASIGGRIDYAVTPVFRLGVEVAYANLDADPERAHSVLALFQFEARAKLNETWSVPARIAAGHLFENGAVLRLGAGIAAKLAERLEVVLEVAPTFFSTRDGVYPAIGPGIELALEL